MTAKAALDARASRGKNVQLTRGVIGRWREVAAWSG